MAELKLKDGKTLTYDEFSKDTGVKVNIDGKPTDLYEPVFIPNGDDEPTFFGFFEKSSKKVYDIYGNVSKIADENSISI